MTQRHSSNHVRFRPNGTGKFWSVPFRYAPAEHDLMARIAGLRPRHRWADWDRSPFTADSTTYVSVWEKA